MQANKKMFVGSSKTINKKFQNIIKSTLLSATELNPRLYLLRVDLHSPDMKSDDITQTPVQFKIDHDVIRRTFRSIKSQLKAKEIKKRKEGKRVYPHHLKYIWVREIGKISQKTHYHLILIFNRDAYFNCGSFSSEINNLANIISKAWQRALGLKAERKTLIHICKNDFYYLDKNHPSFQNEFNAYLKYFDYLAKDYSKPYNDGYRAIGCSR